jgi:hypothetical protein
MLDLLDLFATFGATILTTNETYHVVKGIPHRNPEILVVNEGSLPTRFTNIRSDVFEHSSYMPDSLNLMEKVARLVGEGGPTEEEWEQMSWGNKSIRQKFPTYEAAKDNYISDFGTEKYDPFEIQLGRRRLVDHVIRRVGRNSLLTEFCLQFSQDRILVTPYHAHALNQLETRREIMVARPAIIAARTGSLLHPELAELEDLLRDPKVTEGKLQKYFEHNPQALQAMGYAQIYPQVVLEREDGTSLRPDFLLEPIGSKWCDILDLKLPEVKTIVGGRDRMAFSAALTSLTAQLREYAAYFEDERLSKRVEGVYGIKCYKPKLIGVIGRNVQHADERQQRRLMTSYSDLTVMTFDQVLQVARSRLLI